MTDTFSIEYSADADILTLRSCPPYRGQITEELIDLVIVRRHPVTLEIEQMEIVGFKERQLPFTLDLEPDGRFDAAALTKLATDMLAHASTNSRPRLATADADRPRGKSPSISYDGGTDVLQIDFLPMVEEVEFSYLDDHTVIARDLAAGHLQRIMLEHFSRRTFSHDQLLQLPVDAQVRDIIASMNSFYRQAA